MVLKVVQFSLLKDECQSPACKNSSSIRSLTSIMTTRKTGGLLHPYKGMLPASA